MNFRVVAVMASAFVLAYVMFANLGDSLFIQILRQWVPVLFLSLFFVFFALNLRKQRTMVQLLARGSALLGQGRVAQAHAIYEEAHALMPKSPSPRLGLAQSNLQLWRLDQALTQLSEGTTGMVGKALRAIAVPSLSLVAALTNDRARGCTRDRGEGARTR